MARTWYIGENIDGSHEVHDNTQINEEETRNLRKQAEIQEPDLDYSKPTMRK